jgi:hypothetical protein
MNTSTDMVDATAASKLQAATNLNQWLPVHEGTDGDNLDKDIQTSNFLLEGKHSYSYTFLPSELSIMDLESRAKWHSDTVAKMSPPHKNYAYDKGKATTSVEASHMQKSFATTYEGANIPLEGRGTSSSPTKLRAEASLVAKKYEGGFIWGVYDRCSSILAAAVVAMKRKPEIIDVKVVKMLTSSAESLFLWGESFHTTDLDFLMEWSCDLKEAIGQYFIDISQAIIHSELFQRRGSSDRSPILRRIGLAPLLLDAEEDAIQLRVASLVDFILPGVGWDLDEGSMAQETEEDASAGEDESEIEDEGLDFARDVDNSVKCLMDLIPSMEQVIRQRERED